LLRAGLNWLLSHRRLWDARRRCLLTRSLWLHCRLGRQCGRFDVVRKDVSELRNRNESDTLIVILVGEKVETGFSCFERFALDSGSIVTNCFHGGQQVN
jgi:tRNA-dihydrouridine synthase